MPRRRPVSQGRPWPVRHGALADRKYTGVTILRRPAEFQAGLRLSAYEVGIEGADNPTWRLSWRRRLSGNPKGNEAVWGHTAARPLLLGPSPGRGSQEMDNGGQPDRRDSAMSRQNPHAAGRLFGLSLAVRLAILQIAAHLERSPRGKSAASADVVGSGGSRKSQDASTASCGGGILDAPVFHAKNADLPQKDRGGRTARPRRACLAGHFTQCSGK